MGLNNRVTHKKIQEMFTLKALVASLIGAGMLTATAAWSQEVTSTDATTTNVITVTGVRAAAESAQNIKKNSDEVMDTIVADDIGKFPDTNVAQTLAHVPGIQVFRNSYEVTSVLIDGLPDVATLLNGRDVFTSTGRYISLAENGPRQQGARCKDDKFFHGALLQLWIENKPAHERVGSEMIEPKTNFPIVSPDLSM